MEQPRSGRKLMARELEDVSVVNRHRLAIAAALAEVRGSVAVPAAGPFLRVSERGEVTTNRGAKIPEAPAPPAPKEERVPLRIQVSMHGDEQLEANHTIASFT